MTAFLKTMLVVTLGVALGLLSTWLAVERGYGFGAVQAGPWTAWPKTGSSEADPYAKAVMARNGEIPPGVAEGLHFLAKSDESGGELNARCEYFVRGPMPVARYWTLSPMTPAGGRLLPDGHRTGFTSAEIARNADGTFEIVVASEVRPGNWLPVLPATPFQLMLRIYDTQVSSTAAVIDARTMPHIARGACS